MSLTRRILLLLLALSVAVAQTTVAFASGCVFHCCRDKQAHPATVASPTCCSKAARQGSSCGRSRRAKKKAACCCRKPRERPGQWLTGGSECRCGKAPPLPSAVQTPGNRSLHHEKFDVVAESILFGTLVRTAFRRSAPTYSEDPQPPPTWISHCALLL